MHVRVKLFAALRQRVSATAESAPGTPLEVHIHAGATLNELIHQLNLPREEVKVMFVNGRARPVDWVLQEGDEIGIFPPVGGG